MSTFSQRVPSADEPTLQYNRVPRVTADFWLVKLMAVTVGETAADFLGDNLGLGLATTSWIMTVVLVGSLILQFAQRKYVPAIYWLSVVTISVVGTLISDNLVDNLGVSLLSTTIAFGLALAATFAAWYAVERALSIHTIYTLRRESFYWLAVLFTFALGTAAGDLVAERMGIGFMAAGFMYGAVVGAIAFAFFVLRMNAILAFWLAYIVTRPVGASFGDYLSQPGAIGGLGLGTTLTSAVFLCCIAAVIIYMTLTREGLEAVTARPDEP